MGKLFKSFCMLLFVTLILFGCSSSDTGTENGTGDPGSEGAQDNENEENNDEKELIYGPDTAGEIEFWTWSTDIYEELIEEFNEVYPEIKVNLSVMPLGELHDKLATTLAAGSGSPDVAMVEVGEFPRYTDGDLLEDFLQPPYDIGRYEDDVPEFNWEQWKTFDGQKMLGVPHGIAPGVFYYREDLYEQVGLPNDPEELGEFIQDPNNFLVAAQTLAANDMY